MIMGKIDTLNGYIEECDKAIKNNNADAELVQRITSIYIGEIMNIAFGLTSSFRSYPKINDIIILRERLINLRDNIEMEEAKAERQLEMLKLQSSISITNNNNSASTSSANATVTVSITNAIERLQALPDTTISQEDKDALEEKLAALQVALDNRDNDKAKLKLTNVLKYIGDKCVDAGIAVLPYLGQVATTI